MKHYLLKLIKLKTFLLFFLLQSCFGDGVNEINLLELDEFDQLLILRDGTQNNSNGIDTFQIILDTIIVREDKECKK